MREDTFNSPYKIQAGVLLNFNFNFNYKFFIEYELWSSTQKVLISANDSQNYNTYSFKKFFIEEQKYSL